MMRVLLIKLVAPFIILPAPRSIAVFADERQRQAPVVTVIKMIFAQANKPALSVPPAAPPSARTAQATGGFHCSRGLPGFPPPACPAAPPVQPGTPHRGRLRSLPAGTLPGCGPRFLPFTVVCFDADERREAPRWYTVWIRVVSVCTVVSRSPSIRTTSPPVYATATSTPSGQRRHRLVSPFAVPAGRRGSGSNEWLLMLYPRVT